MKAVVLAGGLRSGLEIPGSNFPRALWPFPAEPLIALVLKFLARSGCDQIAVCANGKTKLIASELESGAQPWNTLHYSEDPLPRGPAGCLRDLRDWLGTDTFLAIQGTGHYDFDLQAMLAEHRRHAAAITVGARRCPDDVDLIEPAGAYLIEPAVLNFVQPIGYQDFKEQVIPKVLAAGQCVRCHTLRGQALLIHSAGHYLAAIRDAILRQAQAAPAGCQQHTDEWGNPVLIHASARVHPSARITGPAWIDAGVTVETGCVLAGPIVLAAGVHVGQGALMHRAVALRESVIEAHADVFSQVLPCKAKRQARPARPVELPQPASRRAQSETGWAQSRERRPLGRLLDALMPAR